MKLVPDLITENWPLKLSAFALAVFLWGVVTVLPRNRQTLASVPVEVSVRDTAWTTVGPPTPPTVDIMLGGTTRDLLMFPRGTSDLSVEVAIDRVTSPDTVVRLRGDWVSLAPGSNLVVENIVPVSVRVRLEETRSTALPLALRTRGSLRAGLALSRPLGITPAVARVRGPARLIESLDSIRLSPLDLGRLGASGLYRVPVDTAGLGVLSVTPAVASVTASVEAADEVSLRIPVDVEGGTPPGVALIPDSVTLTLQGAESLIEALALDSVRADVPSAGVAGLPDGASMRAPVEVRGVPPLVRASMDADSVLVVRGSLSETLDSGPDPGDDGGEGEGSGGGGGA